MSYRIVTDGEFYYVQKRGWFGWKSFVDTSSGENWPFGSLWDAEVFLADKQAQDRRRQAKMTVVWPSGTP